MNTHQQRMKLAIEEAKLAQVDKEVPVGAVIYKDGVLIGKGHNTREKSGQSIAHAEINAIVDACRNIGGWRLTGSQIYVTLEPCPMCAGAIQQSRIELVYFGAKDYKNGAFGTLMDITEIEGLNHYPEVQSGILENECSQLLKNFFLDLRERK